MPGQGDRKRNGSEERNWDENVFENGKIGGDSSDCKDERGDLDETASGLTSDEGGNRKIPSPGTEREIQQTQEEGGETKENFEGTGGSSNGHQNTVDIKDLDEAWSNGNSSITGINEMVEAREENLGEGNVTEIDMVKDCGPKMASGLMNNFGPNDMVGNPSSKSQQEMGSGKFPTIDNVE
ncbi:hypothetical protein L6452_09338 [Arctium lappa]|uniref:Uncharacterized protein n=1 Tax=Arctium lappa TaxID=4217 RepID=A0ACB9DK79_ARCLA|nr:hypothetical protein L6452_09338 [Arctium lappa]